MKLHLGCGKRFFPGWVHVDLAVYDHIDHNTHVSKLPFIESGSCDLIYASHVLEYFDREEVEECLAEWNRVLRVGGKLRIAVPDFEKLVEIYRETNELKNILGPLYGKMNIHGTTETIYHKTVYDFASITNVLKNRGFEKIKIYEWDKTEPHTSYDDHSQAYFPHMDKKNGLLLSLNVECVKI